MKNKLFLSALTLLGFGGCSDDGGELYTELDMYGTPLVDYRFMGEVTDAEGNPIKGIEVKISSAEDVVSTDSEGAFKTDFSSYADGSHSVTFTDIDGEENGGEFTSKQIDVKWTEAEESDGRDLFDLGTVTLEEEEK
ncbi:MAG: radical SAM-associated putative lipoprotein [Rikenellaceae bacterium]